jgi:hypothetical protein
MAEDAGITEIGLTPAIGVQVGAAYADPMHAHKRFARPRFRRRRGFRQMQAAGFLQYDSFHRAFSKWVG